MITGIAVKNQTKNTEVSIKAPWQSALATAIRDPAELMRLLELDVQPGVGPSAAAQQAFRLLVPHAYANRMRKGDWNDPLLRQVMPLDAEMQILPGYQVDPVGDADAMVAEGVLHKYQGRALLVTTGACAIHCRYCFRRHFPYAEANPAREDWSAALAYVSGQSDVHEVILSGGDPLTLSDARLSALCQRLAAIPHVRTLRFHTRLPVVLPERIDAAFLGWMGRLPARKVMVIHANHAYELQDRRVEQALADLRAAGVTLLNQSVLLRGVNDTLPALCELSEALLDHQVLPYYLHVLDKVVGAAHFDVPEPEALALHQSLRAALPGYMVPRLVREVAGKPGKTLLMSTDNES